MAVEPFKGIVVAMVTPYKRPSLEVDVEAVKWLVERLSEAGVQGVLVGGTTGEKELLSPEEVLRLASAALDAARGGLKVFAGVPSARPSETYEAARMLGELGVDYVLATPPLYYRPSKRSIQDFYVKLAMASGDAGVFAYTIPSHVGYSLDSDVIVDLASIGAVEGVKATVSDLRYLAGLALLAEDRGVHSKFSLLVGSSESLPQALALGYHGAVDAIANVAPRLPLAMVKAWHEGDTKALSRLARLAARLGRAARGGGDIQWTLKAAIKRMGGPVEDLVRQPLEAGSAEELIDVLCGEAREYLLPGLECP